MARKKAPTQNMTETVLDWFEDEASPEEQEYVLNYLARQQRRSVNGQIAKIEQTVKNAVASVRKPRSTGAEAKSERQAKVSQPAVAPVAAATSGPRRTGFGGSAVSTVTKQAVKPSGEGETEVDTD